MYCMYRQMDHVIVLHTDDNNDRTNIIVVCICMQQNVVHVTLPHTQIDIIYYDIVYTRIGVYRK